MVGIGNGNRGREDPVAVLGRDCPFDIQCAAAAVAGGERQIAGIADEEVVAGQAVHGDVQRGGDAHQQSGGIAAQRGEDLGRADRQAGEGHVVAVPDVCRGRLCLWYGDAHDALAGAGDDGDGVSVGVLGEVQRQCDAGGGDTVQRQDAAAPVQAAGGPFAVVQAGGALGQYGGEGVVLSAEGCRTAGEAVFAVGRLAVFLRGDPVEAAVVAAAVQQRGEALSVDVRTAGHLLVAQGCQAVDGVGAAAGVPGVLGQIAQIATEHIHPRGIGAQQGGQGVVGVDVLPLGWGPGPVGLAVEGGEVAEGDRGAAVQVVAVVDGQLCGAAVHAGAVGDAADEGDAGDGALHGREGHVGVAVVVGGLAVLAAGEVGEGGGEAAAADAADVHVGVRAGLCAALGHFDGLRRRLIAIHEDGVGAVAGRDALVQQIAGDGDAAAGVAVRHIIADAAHQAAHADIVAPLGLVHGAGVGVAVGTVDIQLDHGGAPVQIGAGYAHQPADGGFAQELPVFAVVGHGVAGDSAVADGADLRLVLQVFIIVVGNAYQTAQGVGGGVILRPGGTGGGGGVGLALDNGVVVAVEHDVFDLRAGGGAEQTHVVAMGGDVHILDVVVAAVVDTAEPVVQRQIIGFIAPVQLAVVYRAGNGVEVVVCGRAVGGGAVSCAVEVVGLLPGEDRTGAAGAVAGQRHRLCLQRIAAAVGVLQIGIILVVTITACDIARRAALTVDIAPVNVLQLLYGAYLVGLGGRSRRIVGGQGEGVGKEGADGVGQRGVLVGQRPGIVGLGAAGQVQTVIGGLVGDEIEFRHLTVQVIGRRGIESAGHGDAGGEHRLGGAAGGPIVTVAVSGNGAAVVMGDTETAVGLVFAVLDTDRGEIVAAAGGLGLIFPVQQAQNAHIGRGHPVAVMDAAAVVAGDDAGIGVGLAGGVQGLIVLEGIGGGDGAKAAQPGGHAAQGRLVHRGCAGSVCVLV